MAKLTIFFGVALVVLGVVYWWLTGHEHPTALIATWWGCALAVCGYLASTEDIGTRKLWMHVAVTVGLLGFLFPGVRTTIALNHGKTFSNLAVQEQAMMSAVCLVFVALCVRSFITARRARTA